VAELYFEKASRSTLTPMKYKTVHFPDDTVAIVWNNQLLTRDDVAPYLAKFGWVPRDTPGQVELEGLTDDQAADRITWLINNAGQQLEYGVIYDWEEELGNVVKLDQRSIETLREISRVAREVANHYEEKLNGDKST
jgi:hypothetical protein